MEMGPMLTRSKCSCALELPHLKEGQRWEEVWEDLKEHMCARGCDLLRLCCIAERISCASSAIACLSYRISSSKFTVPIRESLCLNKASFVRKCHRSACIKCKIECPSSTKTCKAMPGHQQWGFSPWENRWSEWKRPVFIEQKFFQPTPTPTPVPHFPFPPLPCSSFTPLHWQGNIQYAATSSDVRVLLIKPRDLK